MYAGVDLLLKFPDRRGYLYTDTTFGACKVCLAGAAAVASFEGKPYTKRQANAVAYEIDHLLNDKPTHFNNQGLFRSEGGYKPMTRALAKKVRAWLRSIE